LLYLLKGSGESFRPHIKRKICPDQNVRYFRLRCSWFMRRSLREVPSPNPNEIQLPSNCSECPYPLHGRENGLAQYSDKLRDGCPRNRGSIPGRGK
jgi:hypothetical protein